MATNTTNGTIYFEPLLPECLDGKLTVENDFNFNDADNFAPDSWSYYREEILPSAIAGAVFGFLALLICIAFCIWIGLNYCRCCCKCFRRGSKKAAAAADADAVDSDPSKAPSAQTFAKSSTAATFKTSDDSEISPSAASFRERWQARPRREKWLLGTIVFLGVSTVGLCLWGIPESLLQTNHQISDFWDLFDEVDNTQRNTTAQLVLLRNELETVENALQTLSEEDLTVLQRLPGPVGDVGDTIVNGLNQLQPASAAVSTAVNAIDSALASLDKYVQSEIDYIRERFENPTTTFQTDGRIVAIVILLSVILVCAVVVTILSWRPSRPMILSYTIAILLFFIFLILLVGAGVVRSMVELAHDGCLYAEYYVGNVLVEAVNDPTERQFWRRAVNFYLQPAPPGNNDGEGSALQEITGVDLKPVLDVLDSAPVQGFLTAATSGPVSTALNLVLQDDSVAALGDLATAVPDIVNIVQDVNAMMSRENTWPLNYRAKELICCDTAAAAQLLFICWTTIGAVASALALAAIYRVVSHVRATKKARAAETLAPLVTDEDEVPPSLPAVTTV